MKLRNKIPDEPVITWDSKPLTKCTLEEIKNMHQNTNNICEDVTFENLKTQKDSINVQIAV